MTLPPPHEPPDALELERLRIQGDLTILSVLIAETRLHLEVKRLEAKGSFNPDQPRDDQGRWVATGAGDEPTLDFVPWPRLGHDYTAGPNEVCGSSKPCSREEIADQLARFAVPGQDPAKPVRDGDVSTVLASPLGVAVGKVITSVSADGLIITNQTIEGHIFHDGEFVRQARQSESGSWSITTRGTGINTIPIMSIPNQIFGASVFNQMDDRMRINVRRYHGESKHGKYRSINLGNSLPINISCCSRGS